MLHIGPSLRFRWLASLLSFGHRCISEPHTPVETGSFLLQNNLKHPRALAFRTRTDFYIVSDCHLCFLIEPLGTRPILMPYFFVFSRLPRFENKRKRAVPYHADFLRCQGARVDTDYRPRFGFLWMQDHTRMFVCKVQIFRNWFVICALYFKWFDSIFVNEKVFCIAKGIKHRR